MGTEAPGALALCVCVEERVQWRVNVPNDLRENLVAMHA